jgi:nitroreductase
MSAVPSAITQAGAHQLSHLDEKAKRTLFTGARTANAFADTPVTDAELIAIWDLAKWAPTSANSQPLRVLFVRGGEGRDRLVKHLNEGNRAKTATAPAVAVLAMDTRFHDHIPTVLPYKPELKDVFAGNEDLRAGTASLTRRCKPATSSSRSALRDWRPDQWAASTPRASTPSSSRTAGSTRSW